MENSEFLNTVLNYTALGIPLPRSTDWEGYDKTTRDFLTAQKKSTQKTYKSVFKLILNYPNWIDTQPGKTLTGQEIIESKKADTTYMWEKNAVTFKAWIKTQKTYTGDYYGDCATMTAISALRSFFDYYRVPFKFNQTENRKIADKGEQKTEDYQLTNMVIERMIKVADLREQYIVFGGKSFGLRISDFNSLTYGRFRAVLNLNEQSPLFLGKITTRKEKVPAYPFIDSDFLPVLKTILDVNQHKRNDERILTVQDDEVTTILQRLAKRANIELGGKHLRFHCFRKYLIDRLSTCMSESKWKQIVGKTISEGAYVSPLELRHCYLKAMELTTVTANNVLELSRFNRELADIKQENVKLRERLDGLCPEDFDIVKRIVKDKDLYLTMAEMYKAGLLSFKKEDVKK